MDEFDRMDWVFTLAMLALLFTLDKSGTLGFCLLGGAIGFLLGRLFPHESVRIRPGKEDDPGWIKNR